MCDQLRDGAVLKRQSLNELVSVGVKLCFEHVCVCEQERECLMIVSESRCACVCVRVRERERKKIMFPDDHHNRKQ